MKQKNEPSLWAMGLRPRHALEMLTMTGATFLGILTVLRVLGLA